MKVIRKAGKNLDLIFLISKSVHNSIENLGLNK